MPSTKPAFARSAATVVAADVRALVSLGLLLSLLGLLLGPGAAWLPAT